MTCSAELESDPHAIGEGDRRGSEQAVLQRLPAIIGENQIEAALPLRRQRKIMSDPWAPDRRADPGLPHEAGLEHLILEHCRQREFDDDFSILYRVMREFEQGIAAAIERSLDQKAVNRVAIPWRRPQR